MLLIRALIFIVLVLITSSYATYRLSESFLMASLEAKNELIKQKDEEINKYIAANEYTLLVNDNLRDIIKVGIKTECLKNIQYESVIDK